MLISEAFIHRVRNILRDLHNSSHHTQPHCGQQKEPAAYSWSAALYKLCREIFPVCVHILQMPVLHQVICMVCGREGPSVEFKVRLMSR